MDQLPGVSPTWTASQKITFRFSAVFFLLYVLLNPNGVVPGFDLLYEIYIKPLHSLIPWIGHHILHLSYPITVFTNGSGDTTYDYVIILLIVVLAVIGCGIWTILDRRRNGYRTLQYWLLVIVRYYLATTMIQYGMVKVIKLQFPEPGLSRLLEPYGNSSPMGLAWTFIGYSKGYNYFAGIAETLAGVLLLFRRTTAFGAFLAFIVGANIMAMNYCFDIPVKLLSTMIVIMALFVLSENIRNLFSLFFLHATVRLQSAKPPAIRKRAWFLTGRILKILFVAYVLIGTTSDAILATSKYGETAPKVAMRGVYYVKTFIRNGDTIAPLQTDTTRWKQLLLDGSPSYGYASIRVMNDSSKGSYVFKPDTIHHTLVLYRGVDTTKKYYFSYRFPKKDSLVLVGSWKGDSVQISLQQYDRQNFLLVRRGFNWINEYPMNR
ncbi:MAG TPA: hypothetical protein VGM30_07040 [Puia sp.]|jgi:uncharacterized membrane protein YphA (DoxX/SURF4 family)